MSWLALATCGLAPSLFWIWVLRREDRREPEPLILITLVFVLGCESALATLWLRPYLEPFIPWHPPWWRDAVDAFAVTAGVEESLKFLAFFLGVCWHRELDEPMDGIVYGAAAGLGFAAVENVLYVINTGTPALVLARTFTSTLAHVACSGTLGFFAGMTRFRRRVRRRHLLLAGFATAVTLHGLYDYFLFAFPTLWYVSLLGALPLMLLALSLKLRWAARYVTTSEAAAGAPTSTELL